MTAVAISRDGEYVAYSTGPTDAESLHVRQVANGKDVEVGPGGPGVHGITFSPDGKNLYFVRADEKDPFFKYLYRMPIQGGPALKLISDVDSTVFSLRTDASSRTSVVFSRGTKLRSRLPLQMEAMIVAWNSGLELFYVPAWP